jgi:hypothetical protein
VCLQARHRREHAGARLLDVREGRTRSTHRGLLVRDPDALQCLLAKLLAHPVAGTPWGERLRRVECQRRVRPVAELFEQPVVGAGVRPGENLDRIESVQLREQFVRGVLAVGLCGVELPRCDVGESQPVGPAVVDDGGEVLRLGVGRLEQRPW